MQFATTSSIFIRDDRCRDVGACARGRSNLCARRVLFLVVMIVSWFLEDTRAGA